jgi:hypothetical protein
MRGFITIALILWGINSASQPVEKVIVSLLDARNGEGISKAHLHSSAGYAISNRKGFASLSCLQGDSIFISHISYRDTSIVFEGEDNLELTLYPSIQTLPQAEISSRPKTIFGRENAQVFDFKFKGDSLLILTYTREKMFRSSNEQSKDVFLGCSLIVLSPYWEVLMELPLPDLITDLYKDPLNQYFILGEESNFLLVFSKESIQLEPIEENFFREKIEPLNASNSQSYFIDNFDPSYPEFTHFSLAKNGETEMRELRIIKDDFTMELFRAAYKYLSNRDKLSCFKLEVKTGIDKEIYGAYLSGFHHSIYYHNPYAPIFTDKDTTLIFDHPKGLIVKYDEGDIPLDSIPIDYHKSKKYRFMEKIIRDPDIEKYYALCKRNGLTYFREISIESGIAGNPFALYYPYSENHLIKGDKAYYIYRKNSDSTKHLYVERINRAN